MLVLELVIFPALLDYTKDVYFIEDYEIVKLCKNNLTFYNQEGIEISKKPTHIPYDNESAKKVVMILLC